MNTPKFLYLDGKVVPWEDAKIHVLSPAVTYAASVFEGIRGYWSAQHSELFLFRLEDHLKRLQYSMRVMRFDQEFTLDDLRRPVLELIRANGFREDIHIRLMAYLGGVPKVQSTGPVGLAVQAGPFWPNPHVETGMSACISTWERINDRALPPRIKTTANYANSRMAILEAGRNGYDTAILLTREGKVAEGPVANLFMIRDGVPVTPRITDGILESITRDTLMTLMHRDFGLVTQQRAIDRTELHHAEEAFMCGSGWEITPITSIDRLPVGDGTVGPFTRRLQQAYMRCVRGETESPAGWLEPVWTRST